MGGRTSIVVAHRLTTVERCNRLAVIDGGKIVEEGSFTDLTSKSEGFFANLANGMRKAEEKEKKRMSVLAPQKWVDSVRALHRETANWDSNQDKMRLVR